MPLDPDKLRRDVEARRAARDQGSGPSGRARSGAMATIREHLAAIEGLRGDGASWPDVAAALTAQGILRGDGGPLTGRHLTALIASIRRQDAKRTASQLRRSVRTDLRQAFVGAMPAVEPWEVAPEKLADIIPSQAPNQDSAEALFRRLDQKAQLEAEAAAQKPDFSRGLIK